MKFSLVLVVVLFAIASAQDSQPSKEGIFSGWKQKAIDALKKVGKAVGKTVLDQVKHIVTENLSVKPTKEILEAYGPSSEGIFDHTGDLLWKKAIELYEAEHGASSEGVLTDFDYYSKYSDAQAYLNLNYNSSIYDEAEPSHESLLGTLGGVAIGGLGDLIGGTAGKVISQAGNIIGHLLFAVPSAASTEGIDEPSQEGIISSAGKLLVKGAGKLGKELLKAGFEALPNIFGPIFLARGNFGSYPTIHAPATEIIESAKSGIYQPNTSPQYQECYKYSEQNFSQIFDHYSKNAHACMFAGEEGARGIIGSVQTIALDAAQKVEDAYRYAGNCYLKMGDERVACFENEFTPQVEQYEKQIFDYSKEMSSYVRHFTDINNAFDNCLVNHLGYVRQEVFQVMDEFRRCSYNYVAL